ncbi:MAG: VWA domain-containing protein [Moorea sp. SIO3G5]|nr:VWA domain-containing protein [Moorena sp. SIO3G5]
MNANQKTSLNFFNHLCTDNTPFILRRDGQLPQWQDATLHQSMYEQNPEFYALLAVVETVQPWQQARILFQLLQSSRVGMSADQRCLLNRVTAFLLAILAPDSVLTIFLALKRVRSNHKHTTKAILNYILNHPELADLASSRRPALVDSLEHALGKNVVRACAKMFTQPETEESQTYLRRHLLRFARDPEWVKLIFPLLYKQGTPQTSNGNYKLAHTQYTEKLKGEKLRLKTVTATNRGDISATLVHLYRGGKSPELEQSLDYYVEESVRQLPIFTGKMALVLDASASTRSYGEREFSTLSQSVALQLVLKKCCRNLQVYTVGGSGFPPVPQGHTDLALALLDALESQPDLVAIVSDGYENYYPGDLERVVEALPRCGVETPVVFCHSKFTPADNLTLRRPVPNLPQLEFWHQEDFETVLLSLFSRVNSQEAQTCLQQFLLQKLDQIEKELALWTVIN